MLQEILDTYLEIFPEERDDLKLLAKQLRENQTMNDRRNFVGHVTGSAVVLSPDKTKVLLIYHKFFDMWQQPGGHWERAEPDPRMAAWREAEEEAGVHVAKSLELVSDKPLVPLDIGSNEVPARPARDEPPHHHFDFRYVFVAVDEALTHQEAEVSAAKWVKLDDPDTHRITRATAKLIRFHMV